MDAVEVARALADSPRGVRMDDAERERIVEHLRLVDELVYRTLYGDPLCRTAGLVEFHDALRLPQLICRQRVWIVKAPGGTALARCNAMTPSQPRNNTRPLAVVTGASGHGLGQAFLDQEFDEIEHVIDTNVTGTLYLIHRVGRGMRSRSRGRILVTSSVAGYMPGTFQAVYNGSKAFIDSFSYALRNELKDSGVSGWKNKMETTLANVTPAEMLAEQHRKMAEPGSGKKR